MGSAKQLLDVGGRPMLRAVLEPLLAAAVAGVVVVTHSAIAKQIEVGDLGYVALAINDDERSEMIDSVRQGIRVWRLRAKIGDNDAFLVCPVDHPGITVDDHNACIAAFREDCTRINIATRDGRSGHPIIFPAALARFVESTACDGGLNALPRVHADRVHRVPCASTGVTHDVDTPEDYQQIAH
jgi:nicotine blue oxidoreductase